MSQTAVFFGDGNGSAQALAEMKERCRAEQFEIADRDAVAEPEGLLGALPPDPCAVFLPAVTEDLLGVKLLQAARTAVSAQVVCLYSDTLPDKEYLAMAFRAGADDVIALDADEQTLKVQAARASRLLGIRMQVPQQDAAGSNDRRCMICRSEKWKERLLGLAATAGRIASGEMWLSREAPVLLIVTSSEQQGRAAAEMAGKLGFVTELASTAAAALESAGRNAPRVVLADGTLPDSDVSTLAQDIRKKLQDRPVVIVAWSSSPELEARVLVPGSGVDDFVTKGTTGEARQLLTAALLGSLR
jgi:DNA-binding response OmpR family regulator